MLSARRAQYLGQAHQLRGRRESSSADPRPGANSVYLHTRLGRASGHVSYRRRTVWTSLSTRSRRRRSLLALDPTQRQPQECRVQRVPKVCAPPSAMDTRAGHEGATELYPHQTIRVHRHGVVCAHDRVEGDLLDVVGRGEAQARLLARAGSDRAVLPRQRLSARRGVRRRKPECGGCEPVCGAGDDANREVTVVVKECGTTERRWASPSLQLYYLGIKLKP